jgi:hypothetical protein
MAVHRICRQGYVVGGCPDPADPADHTDAMVHVVACVAEHHHDGQPYPRAAQVLALRGLPVPAHLRATLVDAEQIATRLEAEAKLNTGWADALRYAAGVVRAEAGHHP